MRPRSAVNLIVPVRHDPDGLLDYRLDLAALRNSVQRIRPARGTMTPAEGRASQLRCQGEDLQDVVLVVTPSRNAARYLEQTILSVVQQQGEFEIHYHVQDGGSTDSTLAIARTWVERLHGVGSPGTELEFAL